MGMISTLKTPGRKSILIILLLAILAQGCQLGQRTNQTNESQEASFAEITSARDVNETLELSILEPVQEQQISSGVMSLEIRNMGDQTIVFPGDFGIKGYMYDEASEQWRTVPNSIGYPSGEKLLGGQGDGFPSVSVLHFGTAETWNAGEDSLRVLVRGYFLDSEGTRGAPVAAFADVDITW